jgi:hypothetical protein
VHQVDHYPESHQDARSTKHKISLVIHYGCNYSSFRRLSKADKMTLERAAHALDNNNT